MVYTSQQKQLLDEFDGLVASDDRFDICSKTIYGLVCFRMKVKIIYLLICNILLHFCVADFTVSRSAVERYFTHKMRFGPNSFLMPRFLIAFPFELPRRLAENFATVI